MGSIGRGVLGSAAVATTMAVLLCVLPTPAAHASSTVRFSRLSLEDGLSQTSVNCMVQDRHGLMWFGTQDGLNRFDGYEFTVFRHDPSVEHSLSHNFVWDLFVDSRGDLWIGTEGGGLDRWNPAANGFVHLRHDPADPHSLGDDRVRSIAEDEGGRLWIGTEHGLSRYDRDSGAFAVYRHDDAEPASLGHDQVRVVHVDRSGELWVGTYGGGLDRFDPERDGFVHYRHDPADSDSLSDDRVRTIHQGGDGALWIGTYEGGLNRLDPTTGSFTVYRTSEDPSSLSHDRVRAVLEDRDGTLWIGTDGGLDVARPDGASFDHLRHDPANPASLANDRVLSIFQDRGGLLWVATQAGLSTWNPTITYFSHYRQDATRPSTLSSNIVTAIAQGLDGRVWVGTYGGGLDVLDRESGNVDHHRHDPSRPDSLSDDRVMSLYVDPSGRLWVGTFEGGLGRFLPESRTFENFSHSLSDPTSLSANGVTSMVEDGDGALWVGTYQGGLSRLDRTTGRFTRYEHDPEDAGSLGSDRVLALYRDGEGTLWVGTKGAGLNRFDAATGSFVQYRHDPADPESLSSDVVWSIAEGDDGTLWIGTQGAGLNRWASEDRAAGRVRFRTYTERDGLPNGFIYSILEDEAGRLWMSTNNGVAQLDVATDSFTNYDTTHGLQSNEFNFGAAHAGKTGEIFFGGNNGFNVFHPDKIGRNRHVPPVVFTGIYKLNEPMPLDRPLPELKGIELTHRDYVVSFEFAALDYSAPDRNRYLYMLEGFDEDWVDLGTMRRATYTNLEPGDYVFRVKGSNNDGVWSEEGLSLDVTVIPPPWKTWWAYTLYFAAVAGIVAGYVRAQAKKLEREAEYSRTLEVEVRARTRELAEKNEDLARANSKLEVASLTDSLTGLRNRRYLLTYVPKDLASIDRRYRSRPGVAASSDSPPDCLFLMIDLDGFKRVNDTYGHAAGDKVLLQVCEILGEVFRDSDTIIRWGGDEFLVVCRNVDRPAAENLAERVRVAIAERRFELDERTEVRIGCSIGFAFYPFLRSVPAAVSWEKVVAVADRALYMAKESGRNAWAGILGTTDRPSRDLILRVLEDPMAVARRGEVALAIRFSVEGENGAADTGER